MENIAQKRQKVEENEEVGIEDKKDILTPKERAKIHRERKKMYLKNLESKNQELREEVKILKGENEKLRDRIKLLENKKAVSVISSSVHEEEAKTEPLRLSEQLKVFSLSKHLILLVLICIIWLILLHEFSLIWYEQMFY